MSTCLKLTNDTLIRDREVEMHFERFSGLFALIEDLLTRKSVKYLERIDFLLKNIRHIPVIVHTPMDTEEYVGVIVKRAREMAYDGNGPYLLLEAAHDLSQASEWEGAFESCWYRFAYYYYLDRLESLRNQ